MHARPLPLLRALTVALATTAALLATTVPALPAAAADDPVTWGARTASTEQGIDRENYVYALDAGATLTDAMTVTNYDDAPLDLLVYAADGFTTDAGSLDLLPRDGVSTGVGEWISVDAPDITLAPGESRDVPFTVVVPENAEPGDYAGGVVTSLSNPLEQDGINVDRRLGIRVLVRVSGTLAPSAAIEDLTVGFAAGGGPLSEGRATIEYTVRNTGNTRLSAGQTVAATTLLGLLRVSVPSMEPVPELLPGETWKVSIPVDGVIPLFLVFAEVQLQPQYPDTTGVASIDPVSATASTVAIPWMILVLLIVLAIAVVTLVIAVRTTSRRRTAREAARVAAAVEEALAARVDG